MEREYVLLPETRGSNNPTTIPASRPPSSSSAATSRGGDTISHSSWPQSSRGTQGKQSNLFTSWHPQRKAQVDATVARFFYSCGISFNVACSPFFKEMVAEIAQFGPTYQPPTFDALREKLLEDEVASIKEAILPVRQKWEAYGVSLVGDGWTNIRSTSLEGVLASCRGMPLYIESTECGARQKTAPILCEMWSKAVEYVGPKNVVQFVSDGKATNRAAGGLLQQKYPHITWSPCMAHCLNNLLKDIGGLTWAKTTFATGKEIVTFITRHHFSLALYRTFAKKQLLKYAETRFAYNFLMLRRLRNMRPALKQMVASPEWAAWPTSRSTTAQTCYNEVIQEEYWVKVDQLLRVYINWQQCDTQALKLLITICSCYMFWSRITHLQAGFCVLQKMEKERVEKLAKQGGHSETGISNSAAAESPTLSRPAVTESSTDSNKNVAVAAGVVALIASGWWYYRVNKHVPVEETEELAEL
ncbi:hypothetical protein L7F22_028745 [Adiantum nelumboides]|nr:hypothetical protein [Adiantum nelumboides]